MDAPPLLLVPQTPLKFDIPSLTPSVNYKQPPSLPHNRFSKLEQDRSSSETAIFSIYSMYGDDHSNSRSSWSQSHRRSKDLPSPVSHHTLPDAHRNSALASHGYTSSDLLYYDTEDMAEMSRQPDTVSPPPPNTAEPSVNGARRVSPNLSRPSSTHAPPSSMRISSPQLEAKWSTNGYNRSDSTSEPPSGPSISKELSNSNSHPSTGSSRSSHASHHRLSSLSTRELPPLPPSSHTSPAPTPPRQPSPVVLDLPKLSVKAAGKQPEQFLPSESKVSITPSHGEDVDAFHVRSTYAQLEQSGVKGDGYEEGIERTRARVGASRASQLMADAALGDGKEKTKDLTPKELAFLAKIDRYGFFPIPSHDRLIQLSSSPLLKRLTRSSAGPASAATTAISLTSLPPVPLPAKETSRIAKWTRMLQPLSRDPGGNVETWRIKPSKEAKLRQRTYKGIPDCWRAAVWDLLMGQHANLTTKEMQALGAEYRDTLDKPSSYDIQIDLDVPRTISGHIMFRTRYGAGQRSLFHVLHSFSLHCPSCGYVQGMGPIAATLLCYFDPERVYASLVRLHDAYRLHTVFSPGFPGMLEAIYVQERITEQMMPGVYAAFQKHMISTTSYATKWYITLFANSVPFHTQLRLWDAFLLDGYDVFIAVAVAIVWVYRDQITSASANFETVLSLLSSFFIPEDEDVLLFWIEKTLGDKKLRANMTNWRRGWNNLVTSGKSDTALL